MSVINQKIQTMLFQTRIGSLFCFVLVIFLCLILSGCFLQPVSRVEREYNFVDYDAPALRLAEPVKARLLEKDPETGKWRLIGKGTIPAGAYVKGRAPSGKIDNLMEED